MKFLTWKRFFPTILATSALMGSSLHAQAYYGDQTVTLTFENSRQASRYINLTKYERQSVMVQKLDRYVTVCASADQDGWIDDSGRDYFQMRMDDRAQFLKDHVLGINKTAELVAEKCLKSKPRSYEAFKNEMARCSRSDSRLSNLYNNVVEQHGSENKSALYPTFSSGSQCYSRPIYKWVLEERVEATGSYGFNVSATIDGTPDLLSFEREQVQVTVSAASRVYGAPIVSLSLNSSTYNSYATQTITTNGQTSLNLIPRGRKAISLSRAIVQVSCSSEHDVKLDSSRAGYLKEILSASSGSKIGVSYVGVKGVFNKPMSEWSYAEFSLNDLVGNNLSKATDLSNDVKKIKYSVSIENSRHYVGKESDVVQCN